MLSLKSREKRCPSAVAFRRRPPRATQKHCWLQSRLLAGKKQKRNPETSQHCHEPYCPAPDYDETNPTVPKVTSSPFNRFHPPPSLRHKHLISQRSQINFHIGQCAGDRRLSQRLRRR